jgi:hypothetical protein
MGFPNSFLARPGIFATLSLIAIGSAFAQGFGGFQKEPINASGSYRIIADPTGSAPSPKVHSFSISAGACSKKAYGNGNSDCTFKSVRSQAYEGGGRQPADSWYSWYMYIPPNFPLGAAQKAGGTYSFAYWHNGECPNVDIGAAQNSTGLFLQTNIFGGAGKCNPDRRIGLGSLQSLRGKWHRFEFHIKWSGGSDGIVEAHIDGRRVGALAGRNITKGAPSKNYFKFGIYLHGTRGTEHVVPATAYFARVARAGSREGLN